MKTKILFGLVAGLAMLFTSCSESVSDVIDDEIVAIEQEKSSEVTELLGDSCDFSTPLSQAEIEGILLMREEEKLAHDVYSTFYESYGMPVFNNISKSESVHTSAILHMINGFGLDDPYVEGTGNYSNEAFADLYVQLSEQGSAGLVEALKVGAFIEEYDIADLQELIDETENETIKRVYGNLLRGSTFHLKAFTGILTHMGKSYTPSIISQEEYEAIVNGDEADNETDDEDEGEDTFVPGTGECDGTGPNA